MLQIFNPSNDRLISSVPKTTFSTLQEKIKKGKDFQLTWQQVPYHEKATYIENFKNLLEKNMDSCAQTLSQEMGKPITQALNEVRGTLTRLEWFIRHTKDVIEEDVVLKTDDMTESIRYEPLGLIGNISAWNYPYFVGVNVFIPALLTGNCVLYKPSEFSTLTGMTIDRLLKEAGIPEAAFQLVIGDGEIGSLLTQEKAIDGIFFTGSVETGLKIASATKSRLTALGLELGGKDPVYICDDVNPEMVAPLVADGVLYNAGQSCCAVERIYVHEKVYLSFVESFKKAVDDVKMGDPLSKETYLGPLVHKKQRAHLENQVHDAEKKGATFLVSGGKVDGPGSYFKPVIMLDVNHTMEIMREESFGPIVGIQKVSSDEEAISLMNDSSYGLTAGVYTPDESRAEAVLSKLDAGSVYWNCCDRVSSYLPWSGRKNSGYGVTSSKLGIHSFVKPKGWHKRKK